MNEPVSARNGEPMTHRSVALAGALLAIGCGSPASANDAGNTVHDAGPTEDARGVTDARSATDAASSDARTDLDGGAPSDAAHVPEICDNGVDDDGDTEVDCDDSDCWTLSACVAAHVATLGGSLTACHDPIERSAADEDTACAAIGTPTGSSYPTECASEVDVVATIRFFCDATSLVRAVWIYERLTLPRHTTMLGPRRFESVRYDSASTLDWERYASGASTWVGTSTPPLHSVSSADSLSKITVRMVDPGSSLERLLGLYRVDSIIDFDMPMSMEMDTPLRVGATSFSVPAM